MATQNGIQQLIIKNVEKLVQQMVPTITQMAEKAAIKNIGSLAAELPSTCLIQTELQDLLKLRNSLLDKINIASKTINSLSKITNTIQPIVDTTNKSLQIANTARIAAQVAIKAIPSPPGTPGIVISTINDLKDLEEYLKPIITTNVNKITSITSAADYANSILLKLKNLLSSIDKYLTGCGINPNDLTPLDDKLQQLEESLNNADNTNNATYKGFILEIIEELYSPTVNRRKAIAKNTQGIILLSTPLTFSTENQVLINEIKLLIDSNNLKAN
jgi:DNA repair ATPase RecN